jgi:hypothetical protein
MAKTKCKKQTKHGMYRITDRCGIPKGTSNQFIKSASIHGFSPLNIPEGPLRYYLLSKEYACGKRVKLYKGFIFIFNHTSNRLITAYPLPEKFVEEFNNFMSERKYLN